MIFGLGSLTAWTRAVRLRFMASSAVAVTIGLVLSWVRFGALDFSSALMTYAGVALAHASVDLFNDYFDFKAGIDTSTQRTPFSGGTGVLPRGLLSPHAVYRAAILTLLLGSIIGIYFVFVRGLVVLAIILFAIASIYFYSTRIVNYGFGELFVAAKGLLIVFGTFFVQAGIFDLHPIYLGVIVGLLSSSVLYVNEFPDYEADKAAGRRNLIVRLGRRKAAYFFTIYPSSVYGLILMGVWLGILPIMALATLLTIPITYKVVRLLIQNHSEPGRLVTCMAKTVLSARIIGIIVALSFFVPYYF